MDLRMSQQITLQISDEVARRATTIAAETERSIEEVLTSWLDALVNEVPIEALPDSEVISLTQLQLTKQQEDALSHLLTLNREGTLDTAGRHQLDELMRLYEHGLLRKAQALRVAVHRGLIAPLQS
jgi:hypothetical protein